MLLPAEEILMVGEQKRVVPGGSLTTPNKIYVTNRRIIFRNPKLLGLKADINDFSYEDIANIRLHRGVFSTEIFLKSRFLSDQVALPAVDKDTATRINEYIRKGMRGELPGQLMSQRGMAPAVEGPETARDPIAEVERLYGLKEKGIITVDEFEKLKSRLLGTAPSAPQASQVSAAAAPTVTCPNCGVRQTVSAKFCIQCGTAIGKSVAESTGTSS